MSLSDVPESLVALHFEDWKSDLCFTCHILLCMTLLGIVYRLWEAEKATLNEQLQTLKHMQSNRIATPQDTIDNMQTLHSTLCDNRGSEDSLELVAASLRQELDESHEKEVKTGHMVFCSEILQNERNPCRYCKDLLPVTFNAGFL